MSTAKVQRFRKGGFVDRRQEDSPIYYVQAEVYSALSSAIPGGWRALCSSDSFPLSSILEPPGGMCHRSLPGLAVATSLQLLLHAVRLDLAAHSTTSLSYPVTSRPATIVFSVHLDLVIVIQTVFCSRPAAIACAVCLDRLFVFERSRPCCSSSYVCATLC